MIVEIIYSVIGGFGFAVGALAIFGVAERRNPLIRRARFRGPPSPLNQGGMYGRDADTDTD